MEVIVAVVENLQQIAERGRKTSGSRSALERGPLRLPDDCVGLWSIQRSIDVC